MQDLVSNFFVVKNEAPVQRSLEIVADLPVPGQVNEDVDFMVQAIRHYVKTFRVSLPKDKKINTSMVILIPVKTLDDIYDEFCVLGEDKRPDICFHSFTVKYSGKQQELLTEFVAQFFFNDMPEDSIWLNVMVA